MTTPRALNSRQEEVLWGWWFPRAHVVADLSWEQPDRVVLHLSDPDRGDAAFEAQGHRMIAAVLEQLGQPLTPARRSPCRRWHGR